MDVSKSAAYSNRLAWLAAFQLYNQILDYGQGTAIIQEADDDISMLRPGPDCFPVKLRVTLFVGSLYRHNNNFVAHRAIPQKILLGKRFG